MSELRETPPWPVPVVAMVSSTGGLDAVAASWKSSRRISDTLAAATISNTTSRITTAARP